MDRVCHFEVPYDDKARMESFYGRVFGWQFFPTPGNTPYTFVITAEVDDQFQPKQPGGINGGTYPRGNEGEGGSRSPVIVIEVADCAASLDTVVANGGAKILGPNEVSGMGIYAQVKDTEGNTIGLWQPLHHGPQ